MKRVIAAAALVFVWAVWCPAESDVVLTGVGRALEQHFETFKGTAQTLPLGFRVCKNGSLYMRDEDEDFRGVSAGNVTAGGCYGWTFASNEVAMGYQATEDEFTPGWLGVSVSNATGQAVRGVRLTYEIVYLNNADRASALNVEVGMDGSNFVGVAEGVFATPAARESTGWRRVQKSFIVRFPKPVNNGDRFWLRWYGDDAGGSGSRDEYGLSFVRIMARGPEGTFFSAR